MSEGYEREESAPLAELRFLLATDLPHVGRPPEGDDYLLYPVKTTLFGGKGEEGQWVRQSHAFRKESRHPRPYIAGGIARPRQRA